MKQYTTKLGVKQFKPSMASVRKAMESNKGFCLACGKSQSGVEPDARKYECNHCHAPKVYGAEELVLMGLVH